MKTAFLFSGQGSQYVGMGKELYEQEPIVKEIFDQVHLDFDVRQVCFHGPKEQLQDTAYAQSCIFTLSCALAKLLQAHGIQADGCAGLSLGEYSAYAYAQSFSIQEGALLTRKRGELMAHALPEGTTTMAAIMMLEEASIQQACAEVMKQGLGCCVIANYNCPGQLVITGTKEAVQACMSLCKERGARRCVELAVSGAFHSSLLHEASLSLQEVLRTCTITEPVIPVYNNCSGRQETGEIKDILTKQMVSSVRFEQTIQSMLEDGYRTFIEVGPGTAITGFVKKICKGRDDVLIYHVEDRASLDALCQEWSVKAYGA